jgi:predicted nucleotidyltransferase
LNKRSVFLLQQASAKMAELARHPVLSAYWSQLSLVLKGSTARGNADRYSDIDLVFYTPQEIKNSIVSAYHAQGLTDRLDGIFVLFRNGHYHIESYESLGTYFANHDFIRCWEAEHALALSDPTGRFAQTVREGRAWLFQDQLEIVKHAYLDLQLDLDWMRMPITRADTIAVFLHAAKITQDLCRIAYLLDAKSYPPDKWLAHYLATTRWGRAHGKSLRDYVGICDQVNTLVMHQPFAENPLYKEAASCFIRKTFGSQPWLERWYNYV